MDRAALLNWLESWEDAELDLKRLHDSHAPGEAYYQLLHDYSTRHQTDISPFSPLRTLLLDNDADPKDMPLQEAEWFTSGSDVSIRKHIRYLPSHLHSHRFIEMVWVYRGSCVQWLEQTNDAHRFVLEEGDLMILPPGMRHAIGVQDDSLLLNILIRRSTFNKFFPTLIPADSLLAEYFTSSLYAGGHAPGAIFFRTANDTELLHLVEEMMLELCSEKPYAGEAVNLYMGLFLTLLTRRHGHHAMLPSQNEKKADILPAITRYMRENHSTTSLSDVARHFHISRSYISRLFKEQHHGTFTSCLQILRLEEAVRLLSDTTRKVSEISLQVGFADQTHFIRLFKHHHGATPGQYRKRLREVTCPSKANIQSPSGPCHSF